VWRWLRQFQEFGFVAKGDVRHPVTQQPAGTLSKPTAYPRKPSPDSRSPLRKNPRGRATSWYTPMPIHNTLNPLLTWKLTPLKRFSSEWAFSTYQGEVYVRAASEQTSRVFVAERFAGDPAAVPPNSPWLSDAVPRR
jgi:hypothetical protein